MRSTASRTLAYGVTAGFLICAVALISFCIPFWLFDKNESFNVLEKRRKRILLFGDSITQYGHNPANNGWVNSLSHWWTRRVDILNRGFSGYNSKWALMVLNKVVISENPDIVFIFFGANDAIDASVKQHVPINQFAHNIRLMIRELKSNIKGIGIVLITPPPVWEEQLMATNLLKGKPLASDRSNIRTLEYVNACKNVGIENAVPVVDLWTACEGYSIYRAEFLIDGLHLNSRGNERLFEAVKLTIKENFPDLLPENLPMQLPEWSLINKRATTSTNNS